jgi:hypothetical protein
MWINQVSITCGTHYRSTRVSEMEKYRIHRLDLPLHCTPRVPVRETLHAWPRLPIVISGKVRSTSEVDNIIAALEHNDCICEITLYDLSIPQVKNLLPRGSSHSPSLYLEFCMKDGAGTPSPIHFGVALLLCTMSGRTQVTGHSISGIIESTPVYC